ncbi:MAG: DUF6242 domain-containing protein [Prevotellaceae bacterium]|jgi:hypothetical protein|nr:DUF6242 domain-containing protein [Prevotellaceae bacterium]
MKKYFVILTILAAALTSCVDTSATAEDKNANITSFNVISATSTSLEYSVAFTINHDADGNGYGEIHNTDSLSYTTKLDSLRPIILGSALSSIVIMSGKDTVAYQYDGSTVTSLPVIDFSDSIPVKIVTTAKDKKTTKTYSINVRGHKNDPNLYVWKGLTSQLQVYPDNAVGEKLLFFNDKLNLYINTGSAVKLYTSDNGSVWTENTLVGFPNSADIKYIVELSSKLYVFDNNSVYISSDGANWDQHGSSNTVDNMLFVLNEKIYGINNNELKLYELDTTSFVWSQKTTLSSTFPVSGAGICVDTSVTAGNQRAFVVGGEDLNGNLLNSVWSTENGSYWANLAITGNWFSVRSGVAVFQYDNHLMMIGGKDASGVLTDDFQLYSPDFGLSWKALLENMRINSLYVNRYNAQVALDKDKVKIYLVGGQTSSSTFVKDCWLGMKNELAWTIQPSN